MHQKRYFWEFLLQQHHLPRPDEIACLEAVEVDATGVGVSFSPDVKCSGQVNYEDIVSFMEVEFIVIVSFSEPHLVSTRMTTVG